MKSISFFVHTSSMMLSFLILSSRLFALEEIECEKKLLAPPFQRSIVGVSLPIIATTVSVTPSISAIWNVQIYDPQQKLVADAFLYTKKNGEKSDSVDLSLSEEQPKMSGFYTIVWKGKTSFATRLGDVHFNGELFQTDVRMWDPEDEYRVAVLFESKSVKH